MAAIPDRELHPQPSTWPGVEGDNFFIDDLQAVKRDEIDSSHDIERLADDHGAGVHEFELEAQFRCGGSHGFVSWVDSPEELEGIPKSYFWASGPGGIDQVGCISTARGFEVDYVGITFGEDLVYRPRQGWIGRKGFSHDRGLQRGTSDEESTRLVRNTYQVLLSRGLKGCYLYVTDARTRDFVERRIDRWSAELAAEQDSDYTEVER